jgi:RNA polymerase sigma factor (sigma-70 family)
MTDEHILRVAAGLSRRYAVRGLHADDLLQESALAALEALRDCPHAGGRPRASHVLIRVRRHLRHLVDQRGAGAGESRRATDSHGAPCPAFHDAADPEPSPPDAASFRELLDRAADVLAPREMAVVRYVFFHGASAAAIAELLGTSAGSVRKALSVALRKLRRRGNEFEGFKVIPL